MGATHGVLADEKVLIGPKASELASKQADLLLLTWLLAGAEAYHAPR